MSSIDRLAEKKEKELRRKAIESFLLAEVRNGKHYFKACDVAEALDLPVRTVGSNIGIIKNESSCLTITRWSGSSTTVWKITEKTESASNDRSREPSDASEVRLPVPTGE